MSFNVISNGTHQQRFIIKQSVAATSSSITI